MFLGVFLMSCSVVWYSAFSTLIQLLNLYPIDVVLVRASMQAMILGVISICQGHPIQVSKESMGLGLLASLVNMSFVTVVHLLPLGTGTILSHSSVGFTALFAWILLKEPVCLFKGFWIVAMFLGQLMVVQPPFLFDINVSTTLILETDHYVGILLGVLSGVGFGLLLVLGSQTDVRPEHYIFLSSFPGILMGSICGPMSAQSQIFNVQGEELPALIAKLMACGGCGLMGFAFLVFAMGRCPSLLQSLISSTECVVSFIVQVFLFKQAMNLVNIFGAAIVVIAITSVTLMDHYRLNTSKGYSKLSVLSSGIEALEDQH